MSLNKFEPTPLDRLLIEGEIHRLLAAYVHNLDDGKIAENAALLAHARFQVVDTVVVGRDEIARFLAANVQHHADGTPRTSHSLSNTIVDVESSTTAKATTYFTVHQEVEGLELQPIVTGRYLDTFELHDGKWRFASRAVQPRQMGELSRHVAPPVNG